VIRAGFGLFHSAFVAAAGQLLPGNLPGLANNSTVLGPPRGFPPPPFAPIVVGRNLSTFPKDWKTSYTEHWNLNIQQGIGQNMVVQAGYVGNRGLHLSPFNELNRVNPATGRRKYPGFGSISNFFNGANSNYNALQLSFRRRLSHGLTVNVNYTWSHSLDQGGVSNGPASANVQDDANLHAEYGNSDYDVRHYLQFDYTYQIPALPWIPKVVGAGWQLNGITVMRAGLPFNVVCGCDPTGIGNTNGRPDRVAGVDPRPSNFDLPTNQLNPAAFQTVTGRFGNLGRNVFTGPSAYNWDFSLFKNFKVRESQGVQFRAEMFNIFNTPPFANPASTFRATPTGPIPATFGRSLATIPAVGGFGSNRQLQFALRYSF
jgi:hypothetical protein